MESLIPKKSNNDSDQDNDNNSPQLAGDFLPVNVSPLAQSTESTQPIQPPQSQFESVQPIKPAKEVGETSIAHNVHQKQAILFKKHFLNDAIFHIEVEKIKPNPFQPRKNFDEESLKELANSIREFGILQPLVVTKIEKETDFGTDVEYQLIAGERRLKAAKLIGLERVPVIVRKVDENKEHLELAIIENLQRADLDPMETARAYARLQDEFGLTQREIAQRLGKSREVVGNTLRLLDLPTDIQEAVSRKQINESQARLLLAVDNPVTQKNLLDEILNNNLTVRQLRFKIQKVSRGETGGENPVKTLINEAEYFEMKSIEEKLKEFLGTQVKIHKRGEGGEIVISFFSSEEIYGLIDKINLGE